MSTAKQKINKICEYCGNPFEAQKVSTRYCSHKCNSVAYMINRCKVSIKQYEELTSKNKAVKQENDLSNRDYLSITEAANLFGLDRSTIYRYVISGTLKGIKLSAKWMSAI